MRRSCCSDQTKKASTFGRLSFWRAAEIALDVVKLAGPVERLAGNLGFCRGPKIMEVAPKMGPSGRFAQTQRAIRFWRVKLGIALVTIRLQDATRVSQMGQEVLFLPVGCKPIDSTWWR